MLLKTSTLRVQLPEAAIVPPVNATLLPAEVAVAVPPEQVVEAFGVAATDKPAGKVKVKADAVSAWVLLVFVIVTVAVELVPDFTGLVPKATAIVGAGITIKLASAED